jgi:VanZ family protein
MLRFIRKYFSAWYVPIIWTLLIAVAMLTPGSYIPNENKFAIPNFDKLVHAGLFGGFVFLWSLYLTTGRRTVLRLLSGFFCFYLLSTGFGVATELMQKYWIPGRDFDLMDIIADMFGAGIGYGLSNLLLLPRKGEENG